MRVFRITKREHVASALSGIGAALAGGRWNSTGVRMGYTANSASLAILEMLVHVDRHDVPPDRRLLTFEIPDDALDVLAQLPKGWDHVPYSPGVRAVGDAWVARRHALALRVPSAIVRREANVLINPAHPRFDEIRLIENEPLTLDSRLFG